VEKVLEILGNVGFDWKVAIANFVNFLIILFILNKFVFKSMSRTLAARRAKIEEGLAMREQAAQDLQNAFAEKAKIVAGARDEESKMLADAHSKAVTLRTEMLAKSEQEAKVIVEKAEGELGRMKRDLHTEWSDKAPRLVVALTEKILTQKFTQGVNEEYVKNLIR
jgi:F-type H+-transporting ATPase subunit b